MKNYTFIIMLFAALSMSAQNLETDTSIVVSGIEVSKTGLVVSNGFAFDTISVDSFGFAEVEQRELLDTISVDSLSILTRLNIIESLDQTVASLDRKIKRLQKKKLPLIKQKRDEQRLIKKTRKKSKGFKSTITKTFEADELPDTKPISNSEALKRILQDRNYKDYKEVSNTYRTTGEIRRVAIELGLESKGRKSDIAKRIFKYLND